MHALCQAENEDIVETKLLTNKTQEETMKKSILMAVSLMAATFIPCAVSAQDATTSATTQQPKQQLQRPKFDPEKMVERRAANMTKKYGLTSDQQTKLKALFKEQMSSRKPGHKGGPNGNRQKLTKEQRDSLQTAMKAEREKFNTSLKSILTEEQYAQYQKDEQARMEQMKNRRGGRPGGNPPAQKSDED